MSKSVMDRTFAWVEGGGEVHEDVPGVGVPVLRGDVHEVARRDGGLTMLTTSVWMCLCVCLACVLMMC